MSLPFGSREAFNRDNGSWKKSTVLLWFELCNGQMQHKKWHKLGKKSRTKKIINKKDAKPLIQ